MPINSWDIDDPLRWKPNLDPLVPKYEPPTFDLNSNLDPILPHYEPPIQDLGPSFDPFLPERELPIPLPPAPIYDIGNNLIGHHNTMTNQIQPVNNMNGGMPFQVQGTFVRDVMGNLVGQLGPGNMMLPPPHIGP